MEEYAKIVTMEEEISKTTTIQSSIAGDFSGNNYSNNSTTINNYGIQVPSYIPATFEELVARNGWGVFPPEIDLDQLYDQYSLPQDDTGKWMFEDIGYIEWRERRESRFLWLCGGPGTGKTMLAKRAAAEFLRGPNAPNGVKVAFHFLPSELSTNGKSANEDQLSQTCLTKVASDLLYSILQQDGSLFDGCKAELGKQGDRFFANPYSLWKVLRKAIQDCQTDSIYIIIDGIDGLGGTSHEELIRRILGLMEIRTVKVFLSSRDVPYISNYLPHNRHECAKINLDTNSFVKEDVETFIRRKVNAWGWPMEQRDKARKCLLAKSDGIFLWASLAVKSLSYFSSGLDFDEFLRKLPLELADVYRTMLDKLLEGGQQRVLSVIQSVALALRPLTFDELSYIMACMEGKTREEKLPCYRVATNQICSRSEKEIRMYVQSSMGFLRATNTTVSIVHHTAIEYLFDETRKDNLPVLSKSEADFTISWECFRYLHHAFGDPGRLPGGAASGNCNESRDSGLGRHPQKIEVGETLWEMARKDLHDAVVKWPCLRYAAESWFIHARRSIENSKDNFRDDSSHPWLKYQFFETSDVIRKPWIELCEDPRMEVLAGEQTPLHIAICLGLTPLVEKTLSDFSEGVNSNWSLHLAARFISGASKILIAKCKRYLLTNPDQDGNTPLHNAAIYGHSLMLKDLIQRLRGDRTCSNEVNKINHSGNTPLHLAFQFDHPEIVDLLVKAGADQTIKNNAQLTASELGAKLERGESLDILKQDEEECTEAKKEVLKELPYLGENPHDLSTILSSNNTNIVNNRSREPSSDCATTFEELIACTGWMASPPEIDLNHLRDENNLPLADTGRWIFEEAEYKEWRASLGSRLLWLHGAPGTGKTMLAKRVAVEFLKELNNPPSGVKLAFHFLPSELPTSMDSANEYWLSQRILAKVASDLLYSILQQDWSLFDGCRAELERQGDRFFNNPFSLWEVLGKAIRDCRADPVYILIDGLDRLKESLCKELIGKILKLMEIRTVKIFLSSRDVPHISNSLPHNPHEFTKINLDTNSSVKEDVEIFIICKVNAWGWDVELRQRAMETLLVKSEGIFLWVSLAIENLFSLSSGPDFDEFLRKPLLGLEGIYRKMLRTLFSREVSREVLSTIWCVALALRPLTFGELGYILVCIEEGSRAGQRSHSLMPDEIQPKTERDIRMYVQSSMGFLRATNTTVSILHNSATEYLFNENREDDLPVLSKAMADLKIARECFRYLHYVFGNEPILPSSEVSGEHRLQVSAPRPDLQDAKQGTPPWEVARKDPLEAAAMWPYLRYAAESWFIHARRGFMISNVKFYDYPADGWIKHQFFEESDDIRKPWIELCGDPKMIILAGEQPTLQIAACLGLEPLVQLAIKRTQPRGFQRLQLLGRDTNQKYYCIPSSQCKPSLLINTDKNGNTPPMPKVLELRFLPTWKLNQKGFNKKNRSGDTLLHLAFQFDYVDIVKLLLEEGADPTIKNNAQLTPSELGAKLGRGYTLKTTWRGTVVVPVEES